MHADVLSDKPLYGSERPSKKQLRNPLKSTQTTPNDELMMPDDDAKVITVHIRHIQCVNKLNHIKYSYMRLNLEKSLELEAIAASERANKIQKQPGRKKCQPQFFLAIAGDGYFLPFCMLCPCAKALDSLAVVISSPACVNCEPRTQTHADDGVAERPRWERRSKTLVEHSLSAWSERIFFENSRFFSHTVPRLVPHWASPHGKNQFIRDKARVTPFAMTGQLCCFNLCLC